MRRPVCTCVILFLAVVLAGIVHAEEPFAAVAARKALEEYLSKIDEIERVAAQRKAEAKERLTKALQQTEQFEAESGARYRGMLGSYFNEEGRIPFILLGVPNGENVFGEHARSLFNGKYDLTRPLATFAARGHVVVPASGTYYLEAGRGYADFKLNDVAYSLVPPAPGNRYRAEVELTQGVYEVYLSVGNNGGQLPEASIRIVDKATETELPIFIYESELRAFWDDLSFGVELIETSKWTREENRME